MFLVHYEAIVHFILAVPNSHDHTRECASKFATAKIECSFVMGKETPLGYPLFLMLMVHLPDIFYIGHLRTQNLIAQCTENCFTQVL